MLFDNSLRCRTGVAIAFGATLVLGGRCAIAAEKPSANADAKSQNGTNKDGADNHKADRDKTDQSKYIRITRDGKNRVVGLDTAITSFRPATARAADVQVDLVAAVHVADKGYYEELNKRFKGYDVVLYELVAPEGTRIPKGGRKDKGGNVISAVQIGMKNALELVYQLDHIDYTRKNFVHADLSPDEFLQSMRDHVPNFGEIIDQILSSAARGPENEVDNEVALAFALFISKHQARSLKRIAAAQFENADGSVAALDGLVGSTLIGQRNKRALEVLKKQIAAGKKKIAIFYGGGHMTDMEKHLRADFSMKADKTEWLRAWDMK